MGYSINDTVVIYDRIRENLRKYKRMPLGDLLDLSVNETMSRTIMTVGTVLMALIALYFFGGEVIRGFTFAMLFGVLVGTYSSVYIAAPFLILIGVKRDWSGRGKRQSQGGAARSQARPPGTEIHSEPSCNERRTGAPRRQWLGSERRCSTEHRIFSVDSSRRDGRASGSAAGRRRRASLLAKGLRRKVRGRRGQGGGRSKRRG